MVTSADVESGVYDSCGVDYSANGASMISGPYGPYDPISRLHRAIRNEISQYEISSYDAFSSSMHVSPCRSTRGDDHADRRLDPSRLARAGQELFELTRFDRKYMPVIARFNQEGRVEVCFLRKQRGYVWSSFAEWIALQPTPNSPNLKDIRNPVDAFRIRLDHHISWYKASGKASRNNLLTLPNELKAEIYSYCIGPQVHPYPALRNRPHAASSTIATGLLYANKEISQAYQDQVYEKTTWNVTCWPVLKAMIRNKADCPIARIKRLVIAMSYDDLFKAFGLTVITPEKTLPKTQYESYWDTVRDTLHDMRLDSLEIQMSPLFGSVADGGCYRKMANLILKAMWPHIEGQPFTITGHIKKDQKDWFERMGREAHHQREVLDAAGFDKELVKFPMEGCKWVKMVYGKDKGAKIDYPNRGGYKWAGIESDLVKDFGELEHPARRLVEPYEWASEWAIETTRNLTCQCKRNCVHEDWVFNDGDDASFNQAQVAIGFQRLQPNVDIDRLFDDIFTEVQDTEDDASSTNSESNEMSVNESDEESNDDSDSSSGASDDSETFADNKSDFTDGAISLYDPIYPADEQSACDGSADETAAENVAATDPYFFAPRAQGDPYASLWLLERRASPELHEEVYSSLNLFERRISPGSDEEVYSSLDFFERQLSARPGNEVAANHVTEQPPNRSSADSPVSTNSSDEGDGVLLSDWVDTRPAAERAETATARYTRLSNLRRILAEGVPT